MTDISKVNNQVIISSELKKLTKGESALLDLMKDKIKTQEAIEINDVIEVWKDSVQTSKKYSFYNPLDEKWSFHHYTQEEIKLKAREWFKRALGALILKARLVVLPIIEI